MKALELVKNYLSARNSEDGAKTLLGSHAHFNLSAYMRRFD
jgi:hypothetical protein